MVGTAMKKEKHATIQYTDFFLITLLFTYNLHVTL